MKENIINKLLYQLNKTYKYDLDTYERVKYGLEVIYLNITKISVILLAAIIFNTTKNTLLFCLFINGLRIFAYGIHAKKSSHCYIYSLICFVLIPYIFSLIHINLIQKILLSFLSLISYALYSPADTHKRPIVNFKQRKKLKLYSIVVCLIYIILIFTLKNELLINLIILAMITESIIINPFTYKLFKLPYDNYKEYLKSGVTNTI